MAVPQSKDWVDLPKPMSCFTVRNAVLKNLNNGNAIQHYSSNTKIVVVQKCVMPEGTYYRTVSAANSNLNHAFSADAFGLPNEVVAPAKPRAKKKTAPQKAKLQPRKVGFFARLFRRKK